ncbi:MAG TPA: hypothetical protein PK829_03125 [Promineifilum sp.]|nr:hypothetical protein [Promineifilum sp.]
MLTADELVEGIFGGQHLALRAEFAGWVRGSRRFAAFADVYRGKIRAKLRHARDEGGLRDVRAELVTAALLLREDRFSLEYEKYAAARTRGPDFTVTFKGHMPFNVEVRRIRNGELDTADAGARTAKLIAVLVDKASQMPPSIINVLWLSAEGEIDADDLTHAVATVRQLAERKDDDYFARRGYRDAADFLGQYQRLSGIVRPAAGAPVLWRNPTARHKIPPDLAAALGRLRGP